MAREQWFIDGWEVTQGQVRDVETRAGLYGAAAMVGDNVGIPNRRGERFVPKVYGPGGFVLNVWLGGNTAAEVQGYWDQFLQAIAHPERLLTVTRVTAAGQQRVALAEARGALAPNPVGNQLMRCGVEFGVPDGVWRSAAQATYTTASTLVSGASIPLAPFAGQTAPNDELKVTLTGPMTNPTVATPDGSSSWTYTGTVGAGQTLAVDSSSWALNGVGVAVNPAALTWKDPRYLTLPVPTPGGTPALVLTATGMTAASKVRVDGPLMWLC